MKYSKLNLVSGYRNDVESYHDTYAIRLDYMNSNRSLTQSGMGFPCCESVKSNMSAFGSDDGASPSSPAAALILGRAPSGMYPGGQ
jgi:hypothetical protein